MEEFFRELGRQHLIAIKLRKAEEQQKPFADVGGVIICQN
jgi:hypothetical protein